jgi:exodeoxyribonuclease VII large subunit
LLSERAQSDIITVTEYSARLGYALRQVGSAAIEGEVQRVRRTERGMLFFDLTDDRSLLRCKVFPRDAARVEHKPKAGDLVQVQIDRPDLYAPQGSLSVIVSAVRLAGEGELLRRRAELISRLTAEGLCDRRRRRPLPRFPRAVGVIAGHGSDAMSDVIRALTDRWPAVHVIACASLVQGTAAPMQLIDSLARLQDHPRVDVIIMARGGGSVQDLVCFDDEGLCRALFACEVPVVCAIGHTDNKPVCNHVAWPALTPSRSAELVVPSAAELRREIAAALERLQVIPGRLDLARQGVAGCAERMCCATVVGACAAHVGETAMEVARALAGFLTHQEQWLTHTRVMLASVPYRADRELGAERETLTSASRALALADNQFARTVHDVRELGARVRQGTHRQHADHARDYGRAIGRLMREVRAGRERRVAHVRGQLQREGELLGERARRLLDEACRRASHQAELIGAHDFRRRGWLLASTMDGEPARSASDLKTGARIHLHLHDGHAHAVVEHATLNDRSHIA